MLNVPPGENSRTSSRKFVFTDRWFKTPRCFNLQSCRILIDKQRWLVFGDMVPFSRSTENSEENENVCY